MVCILLPGSDLCSKFALNLYITESVPKLREFPSHQDPAQDVIHTFATALVASLRTELEEERQAHYQTRTQTESEIVSLRAKLARREAELALCTVRHSHTPPPGLERSSVVNARSASRPKNFKKYGVKPKSQLLTDAEIWKILELGAARDRILEAEVNRLKELVCVYIYSALSSQVIVQLTCDVDAFRAQRCHLESAFTHCTDQSSSSLSTSSD